MIYVNDGLATGPSGSVTMNLPHLNVYGKIKGIDGLGTQIVGNRAPGGYKSKYEIFKALNFDKAKFDKVKDDLTAEAWVDDKVCNPVPISPEASSLYPVTYYWQSRFGRGKDNMGNLIGISMLPTPTVDVMDPRNRVYGMDELNPNWVEIVSRAPVNVNTASREVLLALVIDLKGIFLTDRRRNNPRWGGDLYNGFKVIQTYSPANSPNSSNGGPGDEGDEMGFLYETVPFVGPWQTVAAGQAVSAEKVVDEMIACRNRTGIYATKGFGGPFRTWTQFYAFCDHLVKTGVIKDERNIYFDYPTDSWAVDSSGAGGPMIDSVLQRRHAAQAAADVLKANFNPNLHLNELNPDHNLTLLVDKTDLIVNSTEFCFVPPGLFEVQSIGRILRAKSGSTSVTVEYEAIAEARVHAVVRLYDQFRQTHQKDFYGNAADGYSELSERVALNPTTNNNRSIEIGPEPDQGKAPVENEWSGYIALPTVGGLWKKPNDSKQKYNKKLELMSTPEGEDELGEVFHAHFALDFRAHYHTWQDDIPWVRDEICRRDTDRENFANYASKYEEDCPANQRRPPYDPTWGKPDKHRLCRSFRYVYGTSPGLYYYAPSNLRIDGGYSERHSSISYLCMKSQKIPSDSFCDFELGDVGEDQILSGTDGEDPGVLELGEIS